MDKSIRDLFLRLRRERKLTQDELETITGVSQGLISRLEKDADYQPTTDVFFRAVDGLGLSLSEFFLQLENVSHQTPRLTSPVPSGGDKTLISLGGDAHGPRPIPDADFIRSVAEVLVRAGTLLAAHATGETERSRQPLSRTRASQSSARKRRA